jgi:hypothetical protein
VNNWADDVKKIMMVVMAGGGVIMNTVFVPHLHHLHRHIHPVNVNVSFTSSQLSFHTSTIFTVIFTQST